MNGENMKTRFGIRFTAVVFAALLVLSAASGYLAGQALPDPGPESGGLQMRLVVNTSRANGNDSREISLELLNVTKEPLKLSAQWPYEKDKGDFAEYLKQAVNFIASPEIGPWEGQTMASDRKSPQPEYTLMPDAPLVIKWNTTGRVLKKVENFILDMRTQPLPTDGLYTVHAVVIIGVDGGTVTLSSNEQKVPVGGSTEPPKYSTGRIVRCDPETLIAAIDIGRLHKITPGDCFTVRTGMSEFWRLTIQQAGDKDAEGVLSPSDYYGRDVPDAGPRFPHVGCRVRLITRTEPGAVESPALPVIVPGQGVGDVRFGISHAELETILGKPERIMGGANEYLSRGMAVVVDKDFVNVILFGDMNDPDSPLVKACKYKTDKGIGMGSTLNDLQAAYGTPSSAIDPAEKVRMVSYEHLGGVFTLQDEKVIHMQFRQP